MRECGMFSDMQVPRHVEKVLTHSLQPCIARLNVAAMVNKLQTRANF